MPAAYSTIGAATAFAANATTIGVGHPATVAAGDMLVTVLNVRASTATDDGVTTPSGWTALTDIRSVTGTFGADTGPSHIHVLYKEAVGGETGDLTVTLAGSSSATRAATGRMARFTKSAGETWSLAAATGTDTTTGTAFSVTFGSNPGLAVGDIPCLFLGFPTDALPTYGAETLTAAGMTAAVPTSIVNPSSASGNDVSGHMAVSSLSAGPASGNATWAITLSGTTTNTQGPAILTRLRASVVAGPPRRLMSVRQAVNRAGTY